MTSSVALCCILRNSAKTLDAMLASVCGGKATVPAFDEYVMVLAGESTDGTEDILQRWYERIAAKAPFMIRRFEWVDDFAAARNYAFSLAGAKWRFYLDGDDRFPEAGSFKKYLAQVEARQPNCNVIALPYDYTPGLVRQDTMRCFRWADGWRWERRLHERCVRHPAGPRVIASNTAYVVHHDQTDARALDSLERNVRICEIMRREAVASGDRAQQGEVAYNLGEYAFALSQGSKTGIMEAARWLKEADSLLPTNNIGCLARAKAAYFTALSGDLDGALDLAARAAGLAPEQDEGHIALGIVYSLRGEHERAAVVYDALAKKPQLALRTVDDYLFTVGLRGAYSAQSYLAVGRAADAQNSLASITLEQRQHWFVRTAFLDALQAFNRHLAFDRLHKMWELYVANDEPEKARRLLEIAPSTVADLPEVAQLRRDTDFRFRNILGGWDEYRRCYAALPAQSYDPLKHNLAFIRGLGRAKATLKWAKELRQEGEPVKVLSIGPQDGNIERDVLRANSRIQLTVADASPLAEGQIKALIEEFPGRVRHHPVVNGHYDWSDDTYDAIFIFEVIEHLPSDVGALHQLKNRLATAGTLFLSTPVADYWLNPTTASSRPVHDWWGHVRSHNPSSLWKLIRAEGLDGRLEATDDGTIFLARLKRTRASSGPRGPLAIYVPQTPTPFDAESHHYGHLGGSEEAVIHLAAALAARGYAVTVYAPVPPMREGVRLHAKDGVLYRDVREFDFKGEHGAVLFWRCPALGPALKAAPYRNLLWLHDTHYSVPASAYEAFDEVIVLSKAHARAVEEGDGYCGSFALAQNGINLDELPLFEESTPRDPHKVVYVSSPDRGLTRLLALWPLIRAAVPDATLDIYYSWDMLRAAAKRGDRDATETLATLEAELRELGDGAGVTVHGGVSHDELHRALLGANALAYPTSFYEISCISMMKAQALGCWPVTTAVGALSETVSCGPAWPLGLDPASLDSPQGQAGFAEHLIRVLNDPPGFGVRRRMAIEARNKFSWLAAAEDFVGIIEGRHQ